MARPPSPEQDTLGNAFLVTPNIYKLLMMKTDMNSIRRVWNGSLESQLPHWRNLCNLIAGTPAPIRKQRFAPAEGRIAGKEGGPMADTKDAGRRQLPWLKR